ncbi:hypothetical protein HF086_007020 [Spodoptera exigua]|uniref:Uncharacterized protein n=1 Tax=Spodoptera exigua TaxID=7107 RepID=A0A922MZ04_SPOEX|nr:hypothetical protein HF086_007020 [Spodoptera exigua]
MRSDADERAKPLAFPTTAYAGPEQYGAEYVGPAARGAAAAGARAAYVRAVRAALGRGLTPPPAAPRAPAPPAARAPAPPRPHCLRLAAALLRHHAHPLALTEGGTAGRRGRGAASPEPGPTPGYTASLTRRYFPCLSFIVNSFRRAPEAGINIAGEESAAAAAPRAAPSAGAAPRGALPPEGLCPATSAPPEPACHVSFMTTSLLYKDYPPDLTIVLM